MILGLSSRGMYSIHDQDDQGLIGYYLEKCFQFVFVFILQPNTIIVLFEFHIFHFPLNIFCLGLFIKLSFQDLLCKRKGRYLSAFSILVGRGSLWMGMSKKGVDILFLWCLIFGTPFSMILCIGSNITSMTKSMILFSGLF